MTNNQNSRTRKTVNYRRCILGTDHGRNLQQLVAAALARHPKPADRYEPLNAASDELRVIGKYVTVGESLCGYLSTFERGASQPVIADDPNAESLRLSSLAPPTPESGGAPVQFVPGVVYFAIYQNHVAVVSAKSMRVSTLEQHLNWLLKSKTNELEATVPFSLSDEAQKATKEKISASHVRAIALGHPLMAEVPVAVSAQGAPSGAAGKKKAAKAFRPEGPIVDFIRGMVGDEGAFEKLRLDEVFDGNLEVWVEIRYPKRKRSRPEDAIRLMDTLGVVLRDVEGDQVSLKLANGSTVSGSELKITGTIDATLSTSRLPNEGELLEQMVSWLRTQINAGNVDP